MSDNIISKDELKEAVEGIGKAFDALSLVAKFVPE